MIIRPDVVPDRVINPDGHTDWPAEGMFIELSQTMIVRWLV